MEIGQTYTSENAGQLRAALNGFNDETPIKILLINPATSLPEERVVTFRVESTGLVIDVSS